METNVIRIYDPLDADREALMDELKVPRPVEKTMEYDRASDTFALTVPAVLTARDLQELIVLFSAGLTARGDR